MSFMRGESCKVGLADTWTKGHNCTNEGQKGEIGVQPFGDPDIYPGIVMLLNAGFDQSISITVRHQILGNVVEEVCHLFVTSEKVEESVIWLQQHHMHTMLNEGVKEAYIRSDSNHLGHLDTFHKLSSSTTWASWRCQWLLGQVSGIQRSRTQKKCLSWNPSYCV